MKVDSSTQDIATFFVSTVMGCNPPIVDGRTCRGKNDPGSESASISIISKASAVATE